MAGLCGEEVMQVGSVWRHVWFMSADLVLCWKESMYLHVKSSSFHAARYCPRVSAALCHSTIWSSNSHLPLLRCYLRLAAWKHWRLQKRQSDIVWVESVAIAWYCMPLLYVSVRFRVAKISISLSIKAPTNKASSTTKVEFRSVGHREPMRLKNGF